MCTRPLFEEEAQGNSEMAYLVDYPLLPLIVKRFPIDENEFVIPYDSVRYFFMCEFQLVAAEHSAKQ